MKKCITDLADSIKEKGRAGKNKFMTSTKFSNEEMNLLNELLNHIEAIDKISQVKVNEYKSQKVGLTADMWSEQSKVS